MKKFDEFENSIALKYFKELYNIGAISTDVYEITLAEDRNSIINLDDVGNYREIKIAVLNYLDNVGGISTDAYDMEMEELNR